MNGKLELNGLHRGPSPAAQELIRGWNIAGNTVSKISPDQQKVFKTYYGLRIKLNQFLIYFESLHVVAIGVKFFFNIFSGCLWISIDICRCSNLTKKSFYQAYTRLFEVTNSEKIVSQSYSSLARVGKKRRE